VKVQKPCSAQTGVSSPLCRGAFADLTSTQAGETIFQTFGSQEAQGFLG